MKKALVVGIPMAYQQRLNAYLRGTDTLPAEGWEIEFIPSGRRDRVKVNLKAVTNSLKTTELGAHVLSFIPGERKDEIRRALMPYFRFRWLRNSLLAAASSDACKFLSLLREELAIEALWSEYLKPTHESSALILPCDCFGSTRRCRELWRSAEDASTSERIVSAERKMKDFESEHGRSFDTGRVWVDTKGLKFDHRGARHRVADFPKTWKYSYKMERGFHYDVSRINRGSFSVQDCLGMKHESSPGGHLNIDAFGFVL